MRPILLVFSRVMSIDWCQNWVFWLTSVLQMSVKTHTHIHTKTYTEKHTKQMGLLPTVAGYHALSAILLSFSSCNHFTRNLYHTFLSSYTSCLPLWLSWMRGRLVIRRLLVWPPSGQQRSFVEIDHEISFTVIFSHLLIQEGQLSVLTKECAQYWLTA